MIVATDLGPSARALVEQAHRLAQQSGASLLVVHVFHASPMSSPLFPQRQAEWALTQAASRGAAEAALERLAAELDSQIVSWQLLEGTPAARLLDLAGSDTAAALVVGATPDGLGEVALQAIRHATCPVFVVRPTTTGIADGPVLAATDFSDAASPAIRAGAAQAALRGVPLEVTHVIEPLRQLIASPEWMSLSTYAPDPPERQLADATRALHDQVRRLGLGCAVHAVIGDPAAGVVERARSLNAQLVVVGSVGRSGIRRYVLGSVAERIASTAPCTVMVTRLHRHRAAAATRLRIHTSHRHSTGRG